MLSLILFLVVVGVLLWAVNTFVPMDPKIKTILQIVVVILVLIYLFDYFAVGNYLSRHGIK